MPITKTFEQMKAEYLESDLHKSRVHDIYNMFDKIEDEKNRDRIDSFLLYSDFYTAPASTKFHLHVLGGLSQHCIDVYNELRKISEAYYLSLDFIAKISILHDVCKLGLYKGKISTYYKTKGQVSWETNPEELPIGHGEKSVIICLLNGIKLTNKEIISIRWHMGFEDYWYSYKSLKDKINKVCYEHRFLKEKDSLASHFEGVKEE